MAQTLYDDLPGDLVPCASCPLRALPAFKPNTPEEIAFIEGMRLGQTTLPAGATIIEEGAESAPLYALFSGWAFRYKTLRNGSRQILNFLLPGDVIGFQAHMLGESAHGVESLTEVTLCRHARPRIWELYRSHPELAFDATWLTAKEESLVDEILTSVGQRTAAGRIAMLMVSLFKRARALETQPHEIVRIPITQLHIADALGLSLVHTNKTMRRLQAQGLFRFHQQQLQILDLSGLERVSEYYAAPQSPRPLL
jgi:CRP/FNR family transcriptional regulator